MFLEFFAHFKKKKKPVILKKVFRPLIQYIVEALLATITATSLLGQVPTSFAHLDFSGLSCSIWQSLSISIRLDRKRLNFHLQVSPQMLYGVEVWALAGPLKNNQRLVLRSLQCCPGCVLWVTQSSSCREVNRPPGLRSHALWSRLSSRTSLFLASCVDPSDLTSLPAPATEKWSAAEMAILPANSPISAKDYWSSVWATVGKSPGGSRLFCVPCSLWTFKAWEMVWYLCPDLCPATFLSWRFAGSSWNLIASFCPDVRCELWDLIYTTVCLSKLFPIKSVCRRLTPKQF